MRRNIATSITLEYERSGACLFDRIKQSELFLPNQIERWVYNCAVNGKNWPQQGSICRKYCRWSRMTGYPAVVKLAGRCPEQSFDAEEIFRLGSRVFLRMRRPLLLTAHVLGQPALREAHVAEAENNSIATA